MINWRKISDELPEIDSWVLAYVSFSGLIYNCKFGNSRDLYKNPGFLIYFNSGDDDTEPDYWCYEHELNLPTD